jgi:hypothetical protein
MLIDLNARRSAEAAKNNEPRMLAVGTDQITLVSEIPLGVVHSLRNGELVEAARALLANPDQDFDRFIGQVTLNDLNYIVENWGTTVGESSGSTAPSAATGEPSPVTSAVSTA